MAVPLLDITPEALRASARRIAARCDELARISSLEGGRISASTSRPSTPAPTG